MLPAATYADVIATFRWEIPAHYNIGVDVADKHVLEGRGDQLALIYETENGAVERFSFSDVAQKSNQLANLLVAHGIRSGDRVAILLPQRPETAIGHVAIYKAGMIAVPLFTLFGPDATRVSPDRQRGARADHGRGEPGEDRADPRRRGRRAYKARRRGRPGSARRYVV
jgi:acetyl-CoA synthetase